MKSFRDYISEENASTISDENLYKRFLELYNNLVPVYDDFQYGDVDMFDKELWDCKNIKRELDNYENILNRVEDIVKKLENIEKYSKGMPFIKKNLESAHRNIDGYRIKNDIIQTILGTARIGDTIEEVAPKLSDMTKTVKSYDVAGRKYTSNFFDYYSEKEIMDEFYKFGHLKLHGEMDLFIDFDEDRVSNIYYEKVSEVYF